MKMRKELLGRPGAGGIHGRRSARGEVADRSGILRDVPTPADGANAAACEMADTATTAARNALENILAAGRERKRKRNRGPRTRERHERFISSLN